mmetsp:Transcript_24958/g.64294  ORF Transcript_24958/g.64294 Transcript_24958/m.64294 type:complete len:208 (+) Transcript_24958:1785-2408(+)
MLATGSTCSTGRCTRRPASMPSRTADAGRNAPPTPAATRLRTASRLPTRRRIFRRDIDTPAACRLGAYAAPSPRFAAKAHRSRRYSSSSVMKRRLACGCDGDSTSSSGSCATWALCRLSATSGGSSCAIRPQSRWPAAMAAHTTCASACLNSRSSVGCLARKRAASCGARAALAVGHAPRRSVPMRTWLRSASATCASCASSRICSL